MHETILVTGGAGFIGSQVNLMLQEAGYRTLVLDNLSRGDRRLILQGDFIQGDIGDISLLNQIFAQNKISAVMHFAASIEVGESVSNPALYYQNNVCNSLKLFDTMCRFGVKALVFSSTAAIFGLPQTPKIAENHPCQPINPYGRSKLMIEAILADFDLAYGLKSCCLRYFNAAGGDPSHRLRNFNPKPSNLVPIALQAVKNHKPLTIYGTDYPTSDGTCIRDYIHIYDLGTAHLLALQQVLQNTTSSHYNLGNGAGFSVREVIDATEKVTGQKLPLIEGPRRPGDPSLLIADSTLARQQLNWSPQYFSLDDIISHAWQALNG